MINEDKDVIVPERNKTDWERAQIKGVAIFYLQAYYGDISKRNIDEDTQHFMAGWLYGLVNDKNLSKEIK